MAKRIERNIKTLAEAETLAASWRADGYRVGVSGQSVNGQHTGLYVVTATGGPKPRRFGAMAKALVAKDKARREAAKASAPVATSAPVRTKRPRRADVIASEFREAGNYWIELKPGFQNGADPGTHAIVEDTKTIARSRLSSVIPCDCAECVALAGKAVR